MLIHYFLSTYTSDDIKSEPNNSSFTSRITICWHQGVVNNYFWQARSYSGPDYNFDSCYWQPDMTFVDQTSRISSIILKTCLACLSTRLIKTC